MNGRVIIVSNRLPLSIVERNGTLVADRSIGGLATALSSVFGRYDPLWVGWTGVRRVLGARDLRSLDIPESLIPVQAPALLIDRYYDRFCNRVLWPALHGSEPCITGTETDWTAYCDMAVRFAKAVQTVVRPDDVIWVHDSQLMMVPQALYDLGVENRIGFFLHTPFPALEFFLGVSHANDILESLCQVDLLGLHTVRDVDNFWSTMAASHLHQQPGHVKAFPIGVDFELHEQAHKRADVRGLVANEARQLQGKRLILSISRLDRTKGILQQLAAVERFFANHPDPKQFQYKLVVAPSRENVPEYQELKGEIDKEVARINKKLGVRTWKPVDYDYRNYDFPEVVAACIAADIMLLAPPIDGMNLLAKEYVAARTRDGVLVLGDQVGAAFQLTDAVLVDATSVDSIVAGLAHAAHMSPVERELRWLSMRANVRSQDVFWWTEQFLAALHKTD